VKKAAIIFLKVAVPAAIFGYLLWNVDAELYRDFWQQPKRWDLMLLAELLALLSVVVSILRWRMLVQAFDIPFTVRESLRLGFLGYLLNLVSFGSVGGDLFKALLVARGNPKRRPEAVASVLLDRCIGLLGLIILASISLLVVRISELPPIFTVIRNWAIGLVIASVAALLLAIYSGTWFDALLNWFAKFPIVGRPLVRMARAVRLLRQRPMTLVVLIAQAVVVHTLLASTVFFVSCGSYPVHPSLVDHFIVVPPALAVGAIPLAPGGLGYQEAALANLFGILPSLPDSFSGMLVATIFRVVTISIAGIGLVFYWLTPKKDLEMPAEPELT
jgi:glycosyltransferase 2 family protein